MDRLKKFLIEKKVNKNFKKAGAGHRLSDSTSRASTAHAGTMQQNAPQVERIASADHAAQAAFKRMNLGAKQETAAQRNIRLRALKELEEERRQRELESNEGKNEVPSAGSHQIDLREFDHSAAIPGVYFTCELLGEDLKLTKSEMKENVESFLRSQLGSDGLVAATLMIFSLNSADRREVASETLQKYIQNLIEKPDEPKFRRIRLNNKAFQERVMSAKGGREFLEACGFEERLEKLEGNSVSESFLIIPDEKASDIPTLVGALDLLQTGQPVPLRLHRNPAVYRFESNQVIANPKLPHDFFDITSAEIKKEQAEKTAEVERMLTLRTREMRERDQTLRSYRYKYTLIRIKFPNHFFLQGTFGCHEKFSTVREFVSQYLSKTEIPLFDLKDPVTNSVLSDDNKTISDLNLVPAAVLHFEWDSDVLAELSRHSPNIPYLDECYTANAEQFVPG